MKEYAIHTRIKAASLEAAVFAVEKQLTIDGLSGTFKIAEVPPTLNTLNVILLENDIPMFVISFRNNPEGSQQAEACFELIAVKMGFLEGKNEEQSMQAVEDGLSLGQMFSGQKLLLISESSGLEDIEELQDLLYSMEEFENDFT